MAITCWICYWRRNSIHSLPSLTLFGSLHSLHHHSRITHTIGSFSQNYPPTHVLYPLIISMNSYFTPNSNAQFSPASPTCSTPTSSIPSIRPRYHHHYFSHLFYWLLLLPPTILHLSSLNYSLSLKKPHFFIRLLCSLYMDLIFSKSMKKSKYVQFIPSVVCTSAHSNETIDRTRKLHTLLRSIPIHVNQKFLPY